MAWTLPRTWIASEIVTAAMMNAHLRDNQLVLKTTRDASGRITAISSAEFLSLDGSSVTGLARLFSGMPVPSAWYRAHTIALANGSAVSSWLDDSGNGRDLSQGTGGLQPVYHTNAASSGFPAVYFDGTGRRFSAALDNVLLTTAGVGTFFVVFRLDSDASGVDVLFYTGNRGAYVENTTPSLVCVAFDGIADGANKVTTRAAWHVATWMYDGTNVYAGHDDADSADLSATASGTQTGLGNPFFVGSDSANHLKGYVAEIIVFPTALSEEARRRIHVMLSTKYGITDGTTAPANPGNSYTDGRHRFTSAARVRVPVGRDKWEPLGVGTRRGVWVEGDYLHHIASDNTTERRYLGAFVSSPGASKSGSLWVEGDWLHYVDQDGDERRCQSIGNASPHVDSFALGGSAWVETYVHWIAEGGTNEMPGHGDFHSDGTVHGDSHTDTHGDVAHSDVGHGDSHGDTHNDVNNPHGDSHSDSHIDECLDPPECFQHQDSHGDGHDDHADHSDTHGDSHTDTAHSDSHTDTHGDVAHSDHSDHGDVAHADAPEVVSA
jgi:hypothetical protein